MWNLEFDVFSLKTIREGFRTEHDRIQEMIAGYTERNRKLAERNGEGDAAEIENVKTLIQKHLNDTNYLQQQMQGIDNEINGFNYVDDKEQQRHHEGILEKVGKLNTRVEMLKEYIGTL